MTRDSSTTRAPDARLHVDAVVSPLLGQIDRRMDVGAGKRSR